MITRDLFNQTKAILLQHARDLEIARFEYLFESGNKERVLDCLKTYQNEDGGFGHGIEPDFWLPDSSPMASWAAGQILHEIKVDKDEPIVKKLISYLIHTYDEETGKWAAVLPKNNDYPHAPWWHWREGVQENWSFNPTVELAANLIYWSDSDSKAAEIGWKSINRAVTHLMNTEEMDKHEINNYQQFIKLIEPHQLVLEAKVPYTLEQLSDKILSLAFDCVNKDISSWDTGYEPLPLDFVESPNNPLCKKLGSLVEQNFDFYLKKLSFDAIWDISWNWGSYPNEFETARRYWKGILAVERYKLFQSFGYLDEVRRG